MVRMFSWVLGLCLAATVSGARAADIGGVVVAAPGQSTAYGTAVEVCSPSPPYDCERFPYVNVTTHGPIGTFRITGLAEGRYLVKAYRDANGSGRMDAGDEAALFSLYPYQAMSPVQTGRMDVAMRLIPYDGDITQMLPDRRADKQRFEGLIPVSAAQLVGRWGGTGPIADNYNAVTGSFVGTTWSADGIEFRANGTYESAYLSQGTSACTVYTDKGTYRVSGDSLTLTATRLEQFTCGRANTVRTRSGTLGATSYWWRFYYYAGSGLKFHMIDKTRFRDDRDWYYAREFAVTGR